MNRTELELYACTPIPAVKENFNPNAEIPYGCTVEHIGFAMDSFTDFLGYVNRQLNVKGIQRLESMLMSANFSSVVGEYLKASIAENCPSLVKNRYHNGHPDLIPAGTFPNDAVQHSQSGIEIKASRYVRGWQGHNPEAIWLMIFVFDSNRSTDSLESAPKPFQYLLVAGAQLIEDDWTFSGRHGESRRTITASINKSGYDKLMANWIYKVASL